jgi:hypothetical protein
VSGASTTTSSGLRRPQRQAAVEAGEDATPPLLLADGGAAASLKDRLRWWRSRLLDRRGGDSCSGGKRVSEALGCSGDGEPSWTRSPARGV